MKRLSIITLLIATTLLLNSCDLAVGIFKAGFWVGIVIVIAIIALMIWLFSRFRNRRRD